MIKPRDGKVNFFPTLETASNAFNLKPSTLFEALKAKKNFIVRKVDGEKFEIATAPSKK